jgi:hypothetical protein
MIITTSTTTTILEGAQYLVEPIHMGILVTPAQLPLGNQNLMFFMCQ